MFGFSNQMWLLADAGTVITILVMFLYAISWIIQKIGEAKNAPPPKGRPARQLPAPQAKELDDFLKRARKGGNRPQAGRRDVDMVHDNELLEVVEDGPPRRPRPMQGQTPQEPKRQKPKTRLQPGMNEPIFERQPLNRPMHEELKPSVGQSQMNQLQEHLTAYMESGRIEKSVAEHLPSLFNDGKSESGNRFATTTGAKTGDVSAAPIEDGNTARNSIIEMFHNPQHVRQAIIVNEILQRPRSLRHD